MKIQHGRDVPSPGIVHQQFPDGTFYALHIRDIFYSFGRFDRGAAKFKNNHKYGISIGYRNGKFNKINKVKKVLLLN
jgi:hypothetical protein